MDAVLRDAVGDTERTATPRGRRELLPEGSIIDLDPLSPLRPNM